MLAGAFPKPSTELMKKFADREPEPTSTYSRALRSRQFPLPDQARQRLAEPARFIASTNAASHN
jgi:hypothetical protein